MTEAFYAGLFLMWPIVAMILIGACSLIVMRIVRWMIDKCKGNADS